MSDAVIITAIICITLIVICSRAERVAVPKEEDKKDE